MGKFDLRAEADVAGKQADERWIRHALQARKPTMHSRKNPACELMEHVVEPEDVSIEEAPKVLIGRRDAVLGKEITHDGRIGSTGKMQAAGSIWDSKLGATHLSKRFFTGATAPDQGAIDIE